MKDILLALNYFTIQLMQLVKMTKLITFIMGVLGGIMLTAAFPELLKLLPFQNTNSTQNPTTQNPSLLWSSAGTIIVFITIQLIVKGILSPKLTAEFKEQQESSIEENAFQGLLIYNKEAMIRRGLILGSTKHIRIKIKNDGLTTAKNVKAILVDVETEKDGKIQSTIYKDSLPLRWSWLGEDQLNANWSTRKIQQKIDLQPGSQDYLDFLVAYEPFLGLDPQNEEKGGLKLATVFTPPGCEHLIRSKGKYIFTIIVCADETAPLKFFMILDRQESLIVWKTDKKITSVPESKKNHLKVGFPEAFKGRRATLPEISQALRLDYELSSYWDIL